jgi:hypothetical protein
VKKPYALFASLYPEPMRGSQRAHSVTSEGTELTLRLFDDLPELLKRVHTKPLFVMRLDVRTLQVGATPSVRKRVRLLQRINVKARSRRQKRGNHSDGRRRAQTHSRISALSGFMLPGGPL